MKKIKYYFRSIKWLYKNRDWTNNPQKWRAMMREVNE